MMPIEYLASERGLTILALLVVAAVVLGLLVSFIFVLPSAWGALRATENRRNGRRVFARHLWWQGVGLTVVLLLFGGVALDLVLVEDSAIRSAIARLGLFIALLFIVSGIVAVPVTRRRMTFARARQLEAEASQIVDTAKDTNAVVHRVEKRQKGEIGKEDRHG